MLFFFSSLLCAIASFQLEIPLTPELITLQKSGHWTEITFPGSYVYWGTGSPKLPEIPVVVALPQGSSAQRLNSIHTSYSTVYGTHSIEPAAAQTILCSRETPAPPVPDETIYKSDSFFPSEPVRLSGSGFLMGHPVAYLLVSPARWNPVTGCIEILEDLRVEIETCAASERTVRCFSTTGRERIQRIVSNTVVNPLDVNYATTPTVNACDLLYGEYIIISHPDYVEQAGVLADWKSRKGIPAGVYTTEWIASNYTGCVDLQQSIRAFLTDCRNEGAQYVLIFGDDDMVPARKALIQYPPDTLYPPVDLYWADINDQIPGEDLWDSNGNGIWGEYGIDQIDYHPDLFTGRASVNSASEADIFLEKVFLYQGLSSNDYFETAPVHTRMGYITQLLWTDPAPCYGSAGAELISTLIPVNSTWEEEKCYESTGNNSYQITMEMLNSSPSSVYQACHGSPLSFSVPNGAVTVSDVMALRNIANGGIPIVFNSIACDIGHFDGYECIADAWLASPEGGGFGGFNARYGWGNAYDPGNGACEIICRGIYEANWVDGQTTLGGMHFLGRDKVAPPEHEVWDWCIKEYNLFGDPEMPVWTSAPAMISVDCPEVINGATELTILVQSESSPLEDALVCLWKGSSWQNAEIYLTGYTDQSGSLSMYAVPETAGFIRLTVSAENHFTLVDSIEVTSLGTEHHPDQTNSLGPLCPNPATATAAIPFSMAAAGTATVQVFDLTGRTVVTLGSGDFAAGQHTLNWDLSGSNGVPVPNGFYSVLVTTPEGVMTERVMVLR